MTAPETLAERLAKCVKPLEWSGWSGTPDTRWAKTPFGLHYVADENGWGYRNYPDTNSVAGGIEAAKAAAQADYTARILAALDMDAIARLVAEAVEAEREGCARIAWESEDVYGARNMQDMAKCARNIAAAIRARSEGGA